MTANKCASFVAFSLSAVAILGVHFGVHAQSKSNATIVQDVELVQIPVIVFDERGAVATQLSKNDFRVTEDGVEQKILYCERERESVSFVILADVSRSMTKKIPFVREAAVSVLDDPDDSDNRYRDEFSLFGFEDRVSRLMPFTRDHQDLEHRIPLLLMPTKGNTALYDGIYAGVSEQERDAQNKRRAVIVISDGEDNHSRYNLRQTKSFLEEADVPVFAVMAGSFFDLADILPMLENKPQLPKFPIHRTDTEYIKPGERRGPGIMKSLTEVTGGGVFTANRLEDLPRIIRTIGLAVRYRYVISYQSHGTEQARHDNNWHKVRVELARKQEFAGYSLPYYKQGYYRSER
jgi:Ca-activated chloride channel family protein